MAKCPECSGRIGYGALCAHSAFTPITCLKCGATLHYDSRSWLRVGTPVMLLEYPIWLWNGWPWTSSLRSDESGILARASATFRDMAEIVLVCRARVDIHNVKGRKRAALDAYRSQMQRLNGNPRWAILADVASGEFLQRFEGDVEIFRRTVYRP